MFKFIFIPSENYFSSNFDNLSYQFNSKLNVDTSSLDNLKNVSEIDLNGLSEFEGVISGTRVKFIDLSFLHSLKPRIHNLSRGFMFPLILLYNLNQVYFLVRGVNLYGTSKKGSDSN